MIRVDRSFFLYANASVVYEGRAKSTLESGNYVILHKGDGTLLIHSNSLFKPLNFQLAGAILKQNGYTLKSTRKDETITITIANIINYYEIDEWSNHKISLSKTEKDLRQQIIDNKELYYTNIKETHIEFQTPVGPVDLLIVQPDQYNVIEVKRKKAGISACSQLMRYINYFKSIEVTCTGVIMSPSITTKAKAHLEQNNLKWVCVNFDEAK